jgi:hypothetical protein
MDYCRSSDKSSHFLKIDLSGIQVKPNLLAHFDYLDLEER